MKSIKELVEEAGVHLIPIGENIYRGSCPFHVNVNTPSFTVYTSNNSWFCFGEGIGGDHINFLSRKEGISYREAKERLEGDIDTLEEITMVLDGMHVKEEINCADELNFSISKYCRDLMYRRPDLVDNIIKFLNHFDKDVLTSAVTTDILKLEMEKVRKLEN